MQFGRHVAGGARLLPRHAEVADVHRLRRIAQVVDLGHAAHAPAGDAGDEVGDAGVALPPVLVRVAPAFEPRDDRRVGGIGHVPDLVRLAAEHAQHVGLGRIALRQRAPVADAHHLRAAFLVVSFQAGQVLQVFRIGRIGDVEDRGAVELGLAGHPVDRLRHVGRAAMVADIGDVAVALPVDGRLVGAARLQVVHADEAHVAGLGRVADLGRLGERGRDETGVRASASRRAMALPPRSCSCARDSILALIPAKAGIQGPHPEPCAGPRVRRIARGLSSGHLRDALERSEVPTYSHSRRPPRWSAR